MVFEYHHDCFGFVIYAATISHIFNPRDYNVSSSSSLFYYGHDYENGCITSHYAEIEDTINSNYNN